MKTCFILAACIGAAALAGAQDDEGALGGYTKMEVDAGQAIINLDGYLEQMTGGVKIRLLADDPELDPLPIQAATMDFTFEEGANQPSLIVMEGNVEVVHNNARIRAARAECDFDKGRLVFMGDPTVTNPQGNSFQGSKIVIDLEEGRSIVENFKASELKLGPAGGGEEQNPALLTEKDITDWSGLLTSLKEAQQAEAPSPGKQIVSQLDPSVQAILRDATVETLLGQKENLLNQMNDVLDSPGLYDAEAWNGIALREEAQALLDKGPESRQERIRLNRWLLDAAYPNAIAPFEPQ